VGALEEHEMADDLMRETVVRILVTNSVVGTLVVTARHVRTRAACGPPWRSDCHCSTRRLTMTSPWCPRGPGASMRHCPIRPTAGSTRS
jgi:hypothetical protein